MPRKIVLDKVVPIKNTSNIQQGEAETYYPDATSNWEDDLLAYHEILKSALTQFPNKLLFSIQDAANALSVSSEFIRKKISDGQIQSVALGDRKMISINELARIIYKGI